MSYALPSAEVAADFKDALQDLKLNSRPEINTLTIIAKENTEHAQAISRELENHIRTTRPEWKLPALYVLDSIVKNVGTPYTVYLGRNLYRTFMDAYTLMDMSTRKAMEGLLRTWKQPVPESLDTRPVFPPEVTREIENALIKYRTVAIQHQQQQARSQKQHISPLPSRIPSETPWRNTPTPPQSSANLSISSDPRVRQATPQQQSNGSGAAAQISSFQQQTESSVDLSKLLSEVEKLIDQAKSEFASNWVDQDIQQRLKALLDLQNILKSQQLSPAQLKLVQDQVMQFSPSSSTTLLSTSVTDIAQALPPPIASPPLPQYFQPPVGPPQPAPAPSASDILSKFLQPSNTPVPSTNSPFSIPDIVQQSNSPSLPPSNPPQSTSLAELLKQYTPQPQAPPLPPPASSTDLAKLLSQNTPAAPSAAAAPSNGNSGWLLEALRARQLLPNTGVPLPVSSAAPTGLPFTLQDLVKRPNSATANLESDIEMTTASLKRPRPHLIASLYSDLPNQCTTCGRRFPSTLAGKEMKSRHMDWHFRVKDPDAAKRGVQRSWYINEREWISYREVDDALPPPVQPANPGGAGGGGIASTTGPSATQKAKQSYIPAPTDAALRNAPCPICQETFTTEWMPESNEFVWRDVIRVGERVYHRSCWEEVSSGLIAAAAASAGTGAGGGGGGSGGRGTPDSVLGKRKAEGGLGGGRVKGR